ncbi:MAG: hypothetical protein ABIG44_07485 [Planctomycetota bacterium]
MRSIAICTRWLFLIVTGGGATIPVSAQGLETPLTSRPATEAYQQLYQEGSARLAAGEHEAAIRLLERALAGAPARVEYAPTLAEAYLAADRAADTQALLKKYPTCEDLWLTWIDNAIRKKQWGVALRRSEKALRHLGTAPAVWYRAAQAHFELGPILKGAWVREVPNGQVGQFDDQWLLVERRGPRRFLCCPAQSALFQLRRALDAGLEEPDAHVLHARIWHELGQSELGLVLLQQREAMLLDGADDARLVVFTELALKAGALDDYLRYSRLRAEHQSRQGDAIMGAAYLAVARRYAERGDVALHREFCHRALSLRPVDVELMLRIGDLEWAAERWPEAQILYRRVLQREPDHAQRTRILERIADRPPEASRVSP